jgi:glycosyltransferase involved in cell wall biosynthesis
VRIAIDQSAGFNQGAGIGRYARHLVPALVGELSDARFTLWYAPDDGARFAAQATGPLARAEDVRVRHTRIPRRRMDQLWFRLRAPLPIELWTGRQDVVYSPDFTAPPAIRTPRIVTIHDLAFEIVPERAPKGLRDYLSAAVPRAVREAAAVVAVSETTRDDLVERLGIDPDRVTIVPNAADARFFAATPLDEATRTRLGLPEQYLLTVGTIEPRKNHLTLFEALDRLSSSVRVPLVVAGRVGWSADEVVAAAEACRARGTVILLDYLADELLPGVYAGAAALVYPSWYEGFGLPVVEGLATGVPVVASDVPAHREVGGDQVVYAPPGDADALAIAIESALTAPQGTASARRARAARYSWQGSGKTLAGLIDEVVAT